MTLDIEAIERRAAAATEGPWERCDGKVSTIARHRKPDVAICSKMGDAAFIAHSREDIPALLAARADLVAALAPFANLGVGSGPGELSETYKIERNAIREARAALIRAGGVAC